MSEPAFTNMDEAAQALAAAVQADAAGEATPPAPTAPAATANQPVEPEQAGAPASQESPAEPDSFTDLSAAIEGLDEQSRQIVEHRLGQMQGDYTRKTQELAEQRRESEQAVQFVQQLQTDPNFALQVQNEIQTALQEAGYTPEEAAQEANRQVVDAQQAPVDGDGLDDPLTKDIEELKEWRAELEARQLQQELENEFDRMDVAVRQANPDFSEEDMQHVYALSYATNGDLNLASEAYKSEIDRIVSAYVDKKSSVSANAPDVPGATGPAQQPPEPFTGLDDPRLQRAAERMLSESLGG